MSVLNKKPFLNSVLESLTSVQLTALKSLLNGVGTKIVRSFINPSCPLTTSDRGVSQCTLETKDRVFTGYLLYNTTYCVLVAYESANQVCHCVKLDITNDSYEIVNEELSILELRSALVEVSALQELQAVIDIFYALFQM